MEAYIRAKLNGRDFHRSFLLRKSEREKDVSVFAIPPGLIPPNYRPVAIVLTKEG